MGERGREGEREKETMREGGEGTWREASRNIILKGLRLEEKELKEECGRSPKKDKCKGGHRKSKL